MHNVIEQARSNGAMITREPSETFYGCYAGVFLDLDGHPWKVAHNAGFAIDDDGNLVLPTVVTATTGASFDANSGVDNQGLTLKVTSRSVSAASLGGRAVVHAGQTASVAAPKLDQPRPVPVVVP